MKSYSYVKVTGTSVADYKIDSYLKSSGNYYTSDYGTTDIRNFYGDTNTPGDGLDSTSNQEWRERMNASRLANGMWLLVTDVAGQLNVNGEQLEFLQFSNMVETFYETGKEKYLTVERINYYVDQDLDSVKESLKSMMISYKDMQINVPYTFKSKDGKVVLDFNMSNDARYNIRDAYYLQQDMKSQDIAFFIENTPIRLNKKYIKELLLNVNEFIYHILIELQRQISNIDAADNIYDAQCSAEWVYEGRDIPVRDRQ